MNTREVWQFLRRWLWLFAVLGLAAGGATYLYTSRLPKVYESSVKMQVTPGQPSNGTTNYNDILVAERLTRTYSEIIKTHPVVEVAAREAGIDLPYERARNLLDVRPLRETQLIQISARAFDPEQAAEFANRVAAVFVQQVQSTQTSRFAASKESLAHQVELLGAEVTDRTTRLDSLRAQPPSAARDGDVGRLQFEMAQLQQNYATVLRSYEELRLAEARGSDFLVVVEPARPSPVPVEPRVLINVLMAVVAALMAAAVIGLLVDHLDDRLVSPERVRRFTGLTLLGSVGKLPPNAPRRVDQIMTAAAATRGEPTAAAVVESLRLLRANLQFAGLERPLGMLLVTSSGKGDGKSTTAANLAIVSAQGGQRVILVDADLRQPSQHRIFEVSNRSGLTSLVLDDQLPLEKVLLPTGVERLSLLTSGALPPNPGELLSSQRFRTRLAELREAADLVVVDSPPVLAASDPAILAGLADGTLLIVHATRTHGQEAGQAVATLQKAGAFVLGAVLNQARHDAVPYYAGYEGSFDPQPAPTSG